MKHKQNGFTLIELIVVIVILGILAATAMPKLLNISDDARMAATQGVAGALASGGNLNYAARSVNSAKGVATSGVTCTSIAGSLLEGGVPTGYTVTGDVPSCIVTDDALSTATATVAVPAIN